MIHKFITPVMLTGDKVTLEGTAKTLIDMGYEWEGTSAKNYYAGNTLVNRFAGVLGKIGYLSTETWGPITTDNPDLFLALAAMTDKEDGIKGEWWVCISDNGSSIKKGNLYKQRRNSSKDVLSIIDDDEEPNGPMGNFFNSFRKATKEEIIAHFSKEEFVLPEKWYIERNEDNYEIINGWAINNRVDEGDTHLYGNMYSFIYSERIDSSSSPRLNGMEKEGYTKITFEQFQKYVLNQKPQEKMERKIVGYKAPYDMFNGAIKRGHLYIPRSDMWAFARRESTVYNLPREIVETWEAVYEEEHWSRKIGTWVKLQGHPDNQFTNKIGKVMSLPSDDTIEVQVPGYHPISITTDIVSLPSPQEIEKVSDVYMSYIGSTDLNVTVSMGEVKIKGKTITYGNLKSLMDKLNVVNNNTVSGWDITLLSDVRFIRIGCEAENNLFSIKEILSVLNIMKKQLQIA